MDKFAIFSQSSLVFLNFSSSSEFYGGGGPQILGPTRPPPVPLPLSPPVVFKDKFIFVYQNIHLRL